MANIYIRKDEVYRTRIEDITNRNQFFYPVYRQATRCLSTMVDYTHRFWNEQDSYHSNDVPDAELWPGSSRKHAHSRPSDNPIRLRGYPNNIIAFSADRGYGKTSAMLSFSTALQTLGRQSDSSFQKIWWNPDFWPKNLLNLHFFVLDPIDPTVLENTDSILPVIISRMFLEFTNHARKMRPASPGGEAAYASRNYSYFQQDLRERQQQLLQKFQDCYRLADDHKDTKRRSENYDDLQLLADRGDSSNFKEHFAELVYSYLNFMSLVPSGPSAPNRRDAFLVIQIDDADMNPQHAYEVVEEIRKYCVLPNVIILFATNMDQLEMCVEQHFLKSFEAILKSVVNGDTSSSHTATHSRIQCHSTAVNYLDKLIPSLHRINLPNINDVLQNYEDHVGLHHDALHTPEQADHPEEYRIVFSNLLRNKCQLDIQFQGNIHHPFLPKHMRELTHFLNRLLTLEDIIRKDEADTFGPPLRELMKWALNTPDSRDCSKNAWIWRRNLETMMNYLVNDWSELSLKAWQVNTIKEIHRAGADQKVAVALESMEQNHFRYKNAQERPHSAADPKDWSSLMNRIAYFQNKQEHLFSSALELYFEMHKELLTVCDCIKKREEVMRNGQT